MSIAERAVSITGEPITLSDEALETFVTSIRGQVVRPSDDAYDATRRVWNGMIDKYPALIARCTGTADVVACVNFAREHDLLVAVRGNGHNVAGNALCDDGLVIDLSSMKGISIDTNARIARVQPGVNWGDLDRETQLHGLVTPGGEVSTTGISGFTLGGGMGLLRRKYGLACDNLIGAEVVLADGSVVRTSETDNPDLLWGLRGGGGNFGVVTSFEFRLMPLGPEVYGAFVIYPFDEAPRLVRAWRDFMAGAPDEITTDANFWALPPLPDLPGDMHGMPVFIITGMYAGSVADGERALQPLRELAEPIVDFSGPDTYTTAQSSFDEFCPDGLLYYWKSLFLNTLDDATIDAIVSAAANRPTPETLIVIRSLGGALGRIPEDATAFGNRAACFNLSLDAIWGDPADSERTIGWTRTCWSELHELAGGGGVYVNFAGFGEDNATLAQGAHRSNHDRLVEVKRKYDPTNLFRTNVNIKP